MKKPLDFENTRVIRVLVDGVRVDVRVDGAGRPVSASGPGFWVGDAKGERLARLALASAMREFELRAARIGETEGARKSLAKRRESAKAHWTGKWFKLALELEPDLGALALSKAASLQCRLNEPETYKARGEGKGFTKYRAQKYLDGQANK